MTSPAETHDELHDELLKLNHQLLASIETGDWKKYKKLCDPSLSAFEPEARGHLVEGMEFHRFYFEIDDGGNQLSTTICDPKVRLLGDDVAVITYVRLTQRLDESKTPFTIKCEETRIWYRQTDGWRHIHFHRSVND